MALGGDLVNGGWVGSVGQGFSLAGGGFGGEGSAVCGGHEATAEGVEVEGYKGEEVEEGAGAGAGAVGGSGRLFHGDR